MVYNLVNSSVPLPCEFVINRSNSGIKIPVTFVRIIFCITNAENEDAEFYGHRWIKLVQVVVLPGNLFTVQLLKFPNTF